MFWLDCLITLVLLNHALKFLNICSNKFGSVRVSFWLCGFCALDSLRFFAGSGGLGGAPFQNGCRPFENGFGSSSDLAEVGHVVEDGALVLDRA